MFFKYIASRFPQLEQELKKARIEDTPVYFVKRMFVNSLAFGIAFSFMVYVFLEKFEMAILMLVLFPIIVILCFIFFMNYPKSRALKIEKNIDAEIVSMIRFISLDIKAGRPIFDTIKDISKNFKVIGRFTDEIIKEVELGTKFEDALEEKANEISSEHFRVVIWQIINHLRTGTDIANALHTIVLEIEEKQRIDFKKFGKKLNAMAVLYMVIAIIIPTIGFTMFAAALIFLGIEVNNILIFGVWGCLTLVQILFLVASTSNRPPVEI